MRASRVVFNAGLANFACFHAQQAAEKSLKAFLIYRGFVLERSHSVDELAQRCAAQDSDFVAIADDAHTVTGFYLDTRYATNDNEFILIQYDLSQAESALEAAEKVFTFVQSKIPPRPQE